MPHPWHLGNDVVDRADPRCQGKARDLRFLRRVFSSEEQEAILSAPDQELALWLRWAAKEAAFKSASKALGTPPVFNHPLFEVYGLEPRGDADRTGQVRFQDMAFSLRVLVTPTAIHAVSWMDPVDAGLPKDSTSPPFQAGMAERPGEGEGWRDVLHPELSPREWDCVSHEGSALTRISAKEALVASLGTGPGTLEIGCYPGLPGRRIPRVFLEGEVCEVDLTLSHHGRFQAWAFRKLIVGYGELS